MIRIIRVLGWMPCLALIGEDASSHITLASDGLLVSGTVVQVEDKTGEILQSHKSQNTFEVVRPHAFIFWKIFVLNWWL